jgi:hypothetical protein
MLGVVISAVLFVAAVALLIAYARNRRCDYGSIQAAEVNPDVAAGEVLLGDALRSAQLQLPVENLPLHVQ